MCLSRLIFVLAYTLHLSCKPIVSFIHGYRALYNVGGGEGDIIMCNIRICADKEREKKQYS